MPMASAKTLRSVQFRRLAAAALAVILIASFAPTALAAAEILVGGLQSVPLL